MARGYANDIVILAHANKVCLILGGQGDIALAKDVRLGAAKLHVDKLGEAVDVVAAVRLDDGRPQAVDLLRRQVAVEHRLGRVEEVDQPVLLVVVLLDGEVRVGAQDAAALVRVGEAAHVDVVANAARQATVGSLDDGLALDTLAGGQGAEAVRHDDHLPPSVQQRLQVLVDDGHVLGVRGAGVCARRG